MTPRLTAIASLVAALLVSACSSSSSSSPSPATGFSVSSATVDSGYTCPPGSSNAPYSVHGTVELHNPTAQTVTIQSVSADMTLTAVKGPWMEKIGEVYRASGATFTPGVVGPQADVSMTVTIPSACTNGNASATGSYGDYSVLVHVVTSAGTYTVSASHFHRITA